MHRCCLASLVFLFFCSGLHLQRAWGESSRGETLLLGPAITPPAATSRGSWTMADGRLEIGKRGFWLAGGQDALLEDGTIRAQLLVGPRTDLTLVVRARLDRRGRRIQAGYALRIQDRWAWFARIRRGVPMLMGKRRKIGRLTNDQSIEVVLSMLGQFLVASIHQHPSDRHLGTLHTGQASSFAGRFGLLGLRHRRQPVSLTLLSTRKACHDIPTSRTDLPRLAALVSPEQASKAALYATELEHLAGPTPRVAFLTDRAGLEQLICDGCRPDSLITDMPYKYYDHAYLNRRAQPPLATATGFRIDQSYKNPQMVEALLKGWHERYPQETLLRTIGKSRQGRPIWAMGIGRNITSVHRRPSMLLSGAHHGDELLSVEFVLDAIQTILEGTESDTRIQRWLTSLAIWCVPVINPDGLVSHLEVSVGTGRKNGYRLRGQLPGRTDRGVDLNRNYPFGWGASGEVASRSAPRSRYYRGPRAASEPETRAVMALAQRERFVAAISFHTGTVVILAPYTVNGVKNPQPNEAWIVAQELAQSLGEHPSKEPFELKRNIYPVEGTDQDWLRHTHGTVALLVEGSPWSPKEQDKRKEILEAVRPIWTRLFDRYLDGPSLGGVVADARGRPINATVRIREIQTYESERWTTRCRDGRFDRFLPRPGRYHLEVTAPGLPPASRTVRVGDKRVQLWIKLAGTSGKAARCRP